MTGTRYGLETSKFGFSVKSYVCNKMSPYNQGWLFVGISHPTKKNPDPGDKKSPGYPEGKKSRKNPESPG